MKAPRRMVFRYWSYYSQKERAREIFYSNFTINKMFELCQEKCIKKGVESTSQLVYRTTFNNLFHLHSKSPQKDTCYTYYARKIWIDTANDNEKGVFQEQR